MRQGCPLSPILFIIVIEMMNIYIQSNKNIKGIKINTETHLISQFADDTSFYLENNKGMIDRLFTALQSYGRMSGLKLNISKTEILLMGTTQKGDIPTNYQHLVKNEVKSLGITMHNNILDTTNHNYKRGKEQLEKALDFWCKKPLSLMGKINMLKSQVICKLVYYMSVLPDPGKDYWKDINKQMFKFISNGKQEKLKRSALINKTTKGGAQMIDIETQGTALRAMWILRAAGKPGPWSEGIRSLLGDMTVNDFMECNLKEEDIPKHMNRNPVWKDIIHSWCKVNYTEEIETVHDIIAETIWLNSHIKNSKKVLWNRKWIDKGIQHIWDITDLTNKDLLNQNQLKNHFDLDTNFLEIEHIKRAIPKEWREKLKHSSEEPDITKGRTTIRIKANNSKEGSRIFYNLLIEKIATGPEKKIQKWIEDLGITTDTAIVGKALIKTRTALIYSKHQSFHYNFLHRNLVYSKRMVKMGLDDSEECKDCGTVEDLNHLFWECPEKRRLWTYLYQRINIDNKPNLSSELCLMNVMVGIKNSKTKNLLRLVNTICAHYIHVKRCKGDKTSIRELHAILKNTRKLEYIMAVEKGKLAQCMERWANIDLD
jgi:hypothetical protein